MLLIVGDEIKVDRISPYQFDCSIEKLDTFRRFSVKALGLIKLGVCGGVFMVSKNDKYLRKNKKEKYFSTVLRIMIVFIKSKHLSA